MTPGSISVAFFWMVATSTPSGWLSPMPPRIAMAQGHNVSPGRSNLGASVNRAFYGVCDFAFRVG